MVAKKDIFDGILLGVNPIVWSNDDMPELGAETSLETCLREADQVGFAGIELGNKFPREPEILQKVISSHDLKIASGWYGAQLLKRSAAEEICEMKEHLNLLIAMGCQTMVFCDVSATVHNQMEVPISERPQLEESQWSEWIAKLDEVALYLADRGVALAYHHHMGTIIQNEEEVARLMEESSDEVHLLFDTGHAMYAEMDPLEVVPIYGERIVHVHAKDVRAHVLQVALQQDWSFLSAVVHGVFTVPGDGVLPFPHIIGQLLEMNYQGWIVVEAEQDPQQAPPFLYAQLGFGHLKDLIEMTLSNRGDYVI